MLGKSSRNQVGAQRLALTPGTWHLTPDTWHLVSPPRPWQLAVGRDFALATNFKYVVSIHLAIGQKNCLE